MALDYAREINDNDLIVMGTTVSNCQSHRVNFSSIYELIFLKYFIKLLNIAVLSIILTAPLGTLLMTMGAKKCLKKERPDSNL